MHWVALAVSILFGTLSIWCAISAKHYESYYDSKICKKGELCSWNHIEVMAGYYTAVTVLGGFALAAFVIFLLGVSKP